MRVRKEKRLHIWPKANVILVHLSYMYFMCASNFWTHVKSMIYAREVSLLLKWSVRTTTKTFILVKSPQTSSPPSVSTDSKAEESWYMLKTSEWWKITTVLHKCSYHVVYLPCWYHWWCWDKIVCSFKHEVVLTIVITSKSMNNLRRGKKKSRIRSSDQSKK